MLVILEGPDGVGKDTVGHLLHLATGWPLIKWPIPGELLFEKTDDSMADTLVLLMMEYLKAVDWSKVNAIAIRHPLISHLVYREKTIIRDIPFIPSSIVILLKRPGVNDKMSSRYAEILEKFGYIWYEVEVSEGRVGLLRTVGQILELIELWIGRWLDVEGELTGCDK